MSENVRCVRSVIGGPGPLAGPKLRFDGITGRSTEKIFKKRSKRSRRRSGRRRDLKCPKMYDMSDQFKALRDQYCV